MLKMKYHNFVEDSNNDILNTFCSKCDMRESIHYIRHYKSLSGKIIYYLECKVCKSRKHYYTEHLPEDPYNLYPQYDL